MTRTCEICKHEIGYRDIHENLHKMFSEEPDLVTASTNRIVFVYWIKYERLLEAFYNAEFHPDNFTSLQRIDREIRNMLPGSLVRKEAREKIEKERHEHYKLAKKEGSQIVNEMFQS